MADKKKLDMLNGSIIPKILIFAFPILVSSILQQLFNAADTAVVGRFAGPIALAAVGGNNSVINLLVNLFNGLSVGANVVIARYLGQKNEEMVKKAVPTVMITALACGLLLALIGYFVAPALLLMMGSPEEVIDLASLYLRIYFLGMPAIMLFNFGAAILRSFGDTQRPLYALFSAGIINIILNVIFVVGFKMSVAGVAIATVISNVVSGGMVVIMLMRHEGIIRLNLKDLTFEPKIFGVVAKIGLPSSLQGVIFSISNVTIQSSVFSFGAYAVSGSAVAQNFENISYFFLAAFVQATVTFMSQNYGAKNYDRCKRIFRSVFPLAIAIHLTADVLLVLLRNPLISIFTDDPRAISFALTRITVITLTHWMMNLYEIPGACMRGLGRAMAPALLSLTFCCGFRLLWIFLYLPSHYSFFNLMIVYPISWSLAALSVCIAWYITKRQLLDNPPLSNVD